MLVQFFSAGYLQEGAYGRSLLSITTKIGHFACPYDCCLGRSVRPPLAATLIKFNIEQPEQNESDRVAHVGGFSSDDKLTSEASKGRLASSF